MKLWLESKLAGDDVAPASAVPSRPLAADSLAAMRRQVWDAWREALAASTSETLPALSPLSEDSASWALPSGIEPGDPRMTFRYGSKGDRPAAGYPLFLYLHGSGDPSREWANGLYFARNFDDAPAAYFVPRIPQTGKWYRWYQQTKQWAWENMLRQALASGEIDPDRIYFFGISEGGYGSQRLASFYADYLAGAGPMAGGEPLKNAPVENCRNIAFSLRTGALDDGFYRNSLTRLTLQAFDSVAADNPGYFRRRIELIPGRGHHIDYTPTTTWLKHYRRNPWPRRVSWEDYDMDSLHRRGFYNLEVLSRPGGDDPGERTRYEMTITGNTVDLTIDRVAYTTTVVDPVWEIDLDFSRSYTPATDGIIRVYLDEHLVDLSRPVTVRVNGHRVWHGRPALTTADILRSCALFGDPRRLYPASVTVDLAEPSNNNAAKAVLTKD
ncbi:MAG: hypothetical protein NC336_02035 [Clostridium sp.]|nr:hypothetical protein [Clostridium sp.]